MGRDTVLIEARNLTKRFGSRTAVDGISFTCAAGTITGLLGANGAGKTTTMRLLTGGLRPDHGHALIAGEDVETAPQAARAATGYLPEAAAGFEHLTPFELLLFVAEARGLAGKPVNAEIARTATALDLEAVLRQPLGTLSKGWRQRAWLAQALIGDPPVLILDEPTDGLDPNQKSALRAELRRLSRDKAILMSTHILEEAEALCDRVIIMTEGRIAADTVTRDLVDHRGKLDAAFARITHPAAAPA